MYDAIHIDCDMSTVPAATLLAHNQQMQWLSSKGHTLHVEHTEEVVYDVGIDQVKHSIYI